MASRPFTARSYPRGEAATVFAQLVDDLAPDMVERGYRVTQRSDMRLRFERVVRKGFLRRKRQEAVLIDVDEGARGTQVVVTGVAPRAVRRVLRDLGD